MNFKLLEQVLKLGRAPEEGISTFLNRDDESLTSPNSPAHLALKDYLEDHDDPRHLIIGKDLSYREYPDNSYNKFFENLTKEVGNNLLHYNKYFTLPDGTELQVAVDDNNKPLRINWDTNKIGGPTFFANLPEEQIHQILSNFGHSLE